MQDTVSLVTDDQSSWHGPASQGHPVRISTCAVIPGRRLSSMGSNSYYPAPHGSSRSPDRARCCGRITELEGSGWRRLPGGGARSGTGHSEVWVVTIGLLLR